MTAISTPPLSSIQRTLLLLLSVNYVVALSIANQTSAFDTSAKHLPRIRRAIGTRGDGSGIHVDSIIAAIVPISVILVSIILLICIKRRFTKKLRRNIDHVGHPLPRARPSFDGRAGSYIAPKPTRTIGGEPVRLPPEAHYINSQLRVDDSIRREDSRLDGRQDLNDAPPPAYFEVFGRGGNSDDEGSSRGASRS